MNFSTNLMDALKQSHCTEIVTDSKSAIFQILLQNFKQEDSIIWTWRPHVGLQSKETRNVHIGSKNPYIAIQSIEFLMRQNKKRCVFILDEFFSHVCTEPFQKSLPEIVRSFLALTSIPHNEHFLILLSSKSMLPPELIERIPILDYTSSSPQNSESLNDFEEIKKIIVDTLKKFAQNGQSVSVNMLPSQQRKFIETLKGLSRDEIHALVEKSISDGLLDEEDIADLIKYKDKFEG